MLNKEDLARKLSKLSEKALIFEVSVSPKPGLVDRFDSGAHKDMDFFTFVESTYSLSEYFYRAALLGLSSKSLELGDLFLSIRQEGIIAEKQMFKATKGINTHKGMVFSIGVLLGAFGYILGSEINYSRKALSDVVKKMTKGISESDFKNIYQKEKKTNGEKLFIKYGIRGIRGEAEEGYKTAIFEALPFLYNELNKGLSLNDSSILTLFKIMSIIDDTNILSRHNMEVLKYVKNLSLNFLEENTADFVSKVSELNKEFIMKNISPGGSADILAVTLNIYFFENEFI